MNESDSTSTAIEFWSTIAETEKDLYNEEEEVRTTL